MTVRPSLVLLCVASSLAIVACGGANDATSPAATTALAGASTANGVSGTTVATITGTVSAFGGSCPTVTFLLERKTIKTSATTSYADGTCASLKNDGKVTVVGATQSDGSVVATSVKITAVTAAPVPAPAPVPVAVPDISGLITAVSGTCPALTITVERKTATTSSATFFDGKGCGDLKVGVMVNIYGTIPAGGTILVATKVAAPR